MIVYVILTQSEEEYIHLFEAISHLKQNHQDIVKEFLGEVVKMVDNPVLQQSILIPTSSIKEFEDKFNEYDDKMDALKDLLKEKDNKINDTQKNLEEYIEKNNNLHEEVERLTIAIRDLSDQNNMLIENEREELTNNYENKLKALLIKNEELESANSTLENQLKNVLEDISALEVENTRLSESLSEYVPKQIFNSLKLEKQTLEKKLIELENTCATDSSTSEALKQTIEKLKLDHQSNIELLEKRYQNQINSFEEHIKFYKEKYNNDNDMTLHVPKTHTFLSNTVHSDVNISEDRYLNMENSNVEFDKSHGTINNNMIEKFEVLQRRFENLRDQHAKDSENWQTKVDNLKKELAHYKKNEKSELSKSIKESSNSKRRPDFSDELIEKMLVLEKENRKIRFENETLQDRLINTTGKMNEHMEILQSVISAYLMN